MRKDAVKSFIACLIGVAFFYMGGFVGVSFAILFWMISFVYFIDS